jgi:ribosomal protein L18
MSLISKKKRQIIRRKMRVKSALKTNKSNLPRVAVFRSLKSFYAQLIDDARHNTLASCSTLDLESAGDKKAQARAVAWNWQSEPKHKALKLRILIVLGFSIMDE